MSISIKRYVEITSGVGAGANVGNRQLIGRIFTTNPLVPTNSHVDFGSADAVASYFGSASVEYAYAVKWFGWVGKQANGAGRLSFAHWNSAASAPQLFGARTRTLVNGWNAITAGSFTLTLGDVSHTFSALNFSTAVSLAAVAAIIQSAINGQSGAMWTGATVTYDSVRGSFNLVGGVTGTNGISVTAGAGGSDIASTLGWLSALAVFSNGAPIQTITDVLSQSASENNNFGSFSFVPTLTLDQIVEAASWNDTQNEMFTYSVPVTPDNAAAISAATFGLSGVTLSLSPFSGEYAELCPMILLSSTDYTKRNTTKNYMFQFFDLTPSVLTDADADLYDSLRVNYYGITQTAGQKLAFYQRGLMMGGPNDATSQNVYANEIWLKDAATSAIMTLFLGLDKVSANAEGRTQLLGILQSVINQGLFNGTISVGKDLTEVQKLFVTNATGDEMAWRQVENIGYWFDAVIREVVMENGITEYEAVYTLIYSKDDVIRKVVGSDILI